MKTPTVLAQLLVVVVLGAPLSLLGTTNDDTVKELKLVRFVEPVFPAAVRQEGVAEGNATLAVSRNEAGEPIDILVLHASNPRLATAAVAAVRQWRFEPAKSDGLAPCVVRLGFKLEGMVIFPYGKKLDSSQAYEPTGADLHVQVSIPQLQSLRQVPKVLAQPMPQYPAVLVDKGRQGSAAVRFYIDEEGRVRLPEVVEATSPEFGAAALTAVSQWRYEPPRKDGRSIVAADHWEFKFQAVN
jgi:TonB family protein